MITVVVPPSALGADEVALDGDAHHHLAIVRRVRPGESVRAVDGRGAARAGRILGVERRRTLVALAEPCPTNEPAADVTLFVAALRPERADWLVENATELGVAAVRFFACARTPREYGTGRLERLRRVAVAAVEQCHRARVPEVSGVHVWDEVRAGVAAAAPCWVFDPAAEAPPGVAPPGSRAVLVVGPEGGLEPDEIAGLRAAGAVGASLGPRVLRVETAAAAGLALVLAEPRGGGPRV